MAIVNSGPKDPSLLNPEDLLNPKFGFRNLQGLSIPSRIALILTPGVDVQNKQNIKQTINFMFSRLDIIDNNFGVLTKAGMGAPAIVHLVEMLYALGVQEVFVFGTAGAINPELKIGDLVLCKDACSDEGTSVHYLPGQDTFSSTSSASERMKKFFPQVREVRTWTTDAPFRETRSKVEHFTKQGCTIVEMEASALFALAQFRSFEVTALFAISDELKENSWKSGFRKAKSNLQEMVDQFISKMTAE
jgi:uridine phosphorylase